MTEPAANTAPPAVAPRPVWHLTLSYDGRAYCGWQIQPDRTTVQGILEARLQHLFNDPELYLAATSRTDVGVHALDQHTSFVVPETVSAEMTPANVKRILNRWLPLDIRVLGCEIREPDFHARYRARGKAYTYVFANTADVTPFEAQYAWVYPNRPLDVPAMRAAAATLEGVHDFASFAANSGVVIDDTVRRIWKVELVQDGAWIYLSVLGESFMYKMVRAIAGLLLHVGRGSCKPEEVRAILDARNRSAAADSAPPQGLFLAKVFWTQDAWKEYVPKLPPFR
jgi:tRNA pseudouridine38-40 synthase